MINSVSIYLEGGGNNTSTRDPFRRGISAFLKPIVDVVRKKKIRWKVVPCGGRAQAYRAFCNAVKHEPDALNLLLVDSEELIEPGASPWEHLKNRVGDGWEKPQSVDDDRCHLMTVCMEAWFLADPAGLAKHFGGNFAVEKLPLPNQAETRTKAQIAEALKKATKPTTAKEYKKIRDGAQLLSTIKPDAVRQYCSWCDRLFTTIASEIGAAI